LALSPIGVYREGSLSQEIKSRQIQQSAKRNVGCGNDKNVQTPSDERILYSFQLFQLKF
jgi:hypothetical protein